MRGMTAAELIEELKRLEPNREVRLVLAGDETELEPVTRENIVTREGAILIKPYLAPMQRPEGDGGVQELNCHDRCEHARRCMFFEEA